MSWSAPFGQDTGLDDQLDAALGGQRRGRGRLGDHRHAGEERTGRLLGEAPGREVEGVDVHRHAPAGHQDVLAPVAPRSSRAGSRRPRSGRSGRRAACPTDVVPARVPVAPSRSNSPSGAVVPLFRRERSSSSSRWSRRTRDISLSSPERCAKVRLRRAGPPLSRAKARISPKSIPWLEARAISSSVEGFTSVANPDVASCQRPAM